MKALHLGAIALGALAGLSTAAFGGTPTFADAAAATDQSGADFTAVLAYSPTGATTGQLTINISNETASNIGGYITALVFNIGSADPGATAHLTNSSKASFLDAQYVNAAPFGSPFVGGAAIGGNWGHSGSTSTGINPGESAQFVFAINASDASSLNDMSFTEGAFDHNFIVRFRKMTNMNSDKVPAMAAVPAPAAAALLGLGGLAASRRRR